MKSQYRKNPALIGVTALLAWVAISILGCSGLSQAPSEPRQAPLKVEYLYDTILFEIAPITSCTPDPSALEYFRSQLEEYRICRTEGVFFLTHPEVDIIPPMPWSVGLIQRYEQMFRQIADPDPADRVGVVFVSYIRGPIMKDAGKIGLLGGMQYSSSAFTIWKDGAGGREAGVLLHELGHLIGVKKQATEPKAHCSSRRCVMWTTTHSPYARFCNDCQEELARIIKARQ